MKAITKLLENNPWMDLLDLGQTHKGPEGNPAGAPVRMHHRNKG
jgi:hypothetical protein